MAEAALAAGVGPLATWEDRSYPLKPLGPVEMGLFEAWLENRVLLKIERMRGMVDEVTYTARHDRAIAQIGAEVYSWHGEAAIVAYQSIAGRKYAFYLNLRHNEGMTEALAGKIFDADPRAAIARMNLAEGHKADDPNPQAPAAT